MSVAWVAGSVRARLLLTRRLEPALVREVAASGSLAAAAALLSESDYAAASTAGDAEAARRVVAARLALHLRVLAAWLPRRGVDILRALAGWFELVDVEDRLAYLTGAPLRQPFALGNLTSVWAAAGGAESPQELRRILAASTWGDPGADTPQAIHAGLRLGWARRVGAEVPEARRWAAGAAAVFLAEELFLAGREPDHVLARRAALGSEWSGAVSVGDLAARLPRQAAWALSGIAAPEELWRADLAWWSSVAADARMLVRSRREGTAVIVGTAALLAVDALRVATALGVAAGPPSAPAGEVLDALC